MDVQNAGNELGVAALVSGRVSLHDNEIEVRAELTDVRDNTELWVSITPTALQWLRIAHKARDLGMERLKTDPFLDPLRQDPRLAELIKTIGLP